MGMFILIFAFLHKSCKDSEYYLYSNKALGIYQGRRMEFI